MRMITAALAAFLFLVSFPAMAQAPLEPEQAALYDRITKELVCLCGCNQSVKACPHVNCDSAVPTRKKIIEYIGQGKGHDEIITLFVKEKGEVILGKPKEEGFNLVGYILPFVAILAVGGLLFKVISDWTKRRPAVATSPAPRESAPASVDSPLAERMKKELSEFED